MQHHIYVVNTVFAFGLYQHVIGFFCSYCYFSWQCGPSQNEGKNWQALITKALLWPGYSIPTVKHCYWFISSISVALRRSCCYVSCYDWPAGLTTVRTENSIPASIRLLYQEQRLKEKVSALFQYQKKKKKNHILVLLETILTPTLYCKAFLCGGACLQDGGCKVRWL